MSRFLVNDITKTDPRALLTAEKMATLSDLVLNTSQYLKCTGTSELRIEPDCIISIGDSGVFKTPAAILKASDLDTGSNFVGGKDYYVYICDPGNNQDEKYVISLNSTYPFGYTAFNSRKIGGFHYGVCRAINEKLQPVNSSNAERGTGWESNVFVGIVPHSVWTITHRPKSAPEGMVYLGSGTWVDIYLSSDDGVGGLASVMNATPLSGTEGLHWYGFVERATVVGKRLLTYHEFCQMAMGSPQGADGNNDNAWTKTTNTGRALTGNVQNAVSSIGCRDAVGNLWEWLDEFVNDPTGATATNYNVFPGYGQASMYSATGLHALIGGGHWLIGSLAGARAVNLNDWPWHVNANVGARCASDSL